VTCLSVWGTSGVVYPAAAFLEIAHSHGATTLVMNKESLPQQSMVDIFMQGSAEDLLPEFFNLK
jgi:NAD-dependent deacetylase